MTTPHDPPHVLRSQVHAALDALGLDWRSTGVTSVTLNAREISITREIPYGHAVTVHAVADDVPPAPKTTRVELSAIPVELGDPVTNMDGGDAFWPWRCRRCRETGVVDITGHGDVRQESMVEHVLTIAQYSHPECRPATEAATRPHPVITTEEAQADV